MQFEFSFEINKWAADFRIKTHQTLCDLQGVVWFFFVASLHVLLQLMAFLLVLILEKIAFPLATFLRHYWKGTQWKSAHSLLQLSFPSPLPLPLNLHSPTQPYAHSHPHTLARPEHALKCNSLPQKRRKLVFNIWNLLERILPHTGSWCLKGLIYYRTSYNPEKVFYFPFESLILGKRPWATQHRVHLIIEFPSYEWITEYT